MRAIACILLNLTGISLLSGCQKILTESPISVAYSTPNLSDTSIELTLAEARRVSLSIFDHQGVLVREVLRGQPYGQGTFTITWDGLDGQGQPAPPGEYTWKQVTHPGFTARYITHIGVNPPSASYHWWPGDHTGVGTVAVDTSGIYFGSRVTEVPPMVVKHSLDGKQQLWQKEQYYQGGRLKRLAAAQGKVYLLKDEGSEGTATHWIRVVAADTGIPQGNWQITGEGVAVADLDCHGDNLVIVLPELGEIRWLDPETPTTVLATVKGLTGVNAVTAVSGDRQGAVLVHTQGTVLWVDPLHNTQDSKITGLSGVVALDLDHTNGDLYLNNTSQGSQVWRYDTHNFRKIQEYGTQHRPWGVYQPELFGEIADVTADQQGGFYTTEPYVYPRQTSHIRSKDGQLLSTWFGGLSYYLVPTIDPQDPAIVWLTGHSTEVVKIRLNVDQKTWDVLEVYSFAEPGDKLFVENRAIGSRWQPVYHQNQLYLVATKRPAILRVDQKAGKLYPVSLTTTVIHDPNNSLWKGSGEAGFPAPWVAAVRAQGFQDLSQAPRSFSWGDRNQNGIMEPEEFLFYPQDFQWNFAGEGVWDEQWNYYLPTLHFGPSDPPFAWYKIPVAQWLDPQKKIPLYDLQQIVPGPAIPPEVNDAYWGRQLARDQTGNIYIVSQSHLTIHESLGGRWPASQNRVNRIIKWNQNQQLIGLISRKVFDPQEKNSGKLYYPMHIRSGPDRTLIVVDQDYTPAAVYTEDGLFIGPLLDQRTADHFPDAVYQASNHQDFQGFALTEFPDGRRFWVGPQPGGLPVYESLGWDKIERKTGKLQLDQLVKKAKLAGTGLKGTLYQENNLLGEFSFAKIDIEPYNPSPISSVAPADFKMVWTGAVEGIFTEDYQFYLYLKKPEDRGKIWIGDRLVFDSTNPAQSVVKVPLKTGEKYPIKIEWINQGGNPTIRLIWTSTTLDPQVIPPTVLYPN